MKFGIREAVDVVFKAASAITIGNTSFEKHEPVIYFDSLKSSTTEGDAATVYAQGGKGNPRLIAWEGDKTITFTFEDALISPLGMAVLTGAGIVDASATNKVTVHRRIITTGTVPAGGGKINVDLTDAIGPHALSSEDIFGFKVDASGEETTERLKKGTVNGNIVSFNAAGAVADASYNVMVDFYIVQESGITEITITPDKFAGYYYVEGDTLFRRQSDGKDLAAQLIIPNVKIQSKFTFAMSPSGDPSTFTFTGDAFPGLIKGDKTGKKTMYAIQMASN